MFLSPFLMFDFVQITLLFCVFTESKQIIPIPASLSALKHFETQMNARGIFRLNQIWDTKEVNVSGLGSALWSLSPHPDDSHLWYGHVLGSSCTDYMPAGLSPSPKHTQTLTQTAHIRSWTSLNGELWPYLALPADLFVLAKEPL